MTSAIIKTMKSLGIISNLCLSNLYYSVNHITTRIDK